MRAHWSGTKPRLEPARPYWNYEDIGVFLLVVVLLGSVLRFLVRFRLFQRSELTDPSFGLQFAVVASLSLALYLVLKFRHHQPVLQPLGGVWPPTAYIVAAVVGGVSFASGVPLYLRFRNQSTQAMPIIEILVLGFVLGPILEESIPRMFTARFGPHYRQPSGSDFDRSSVCAVSPAIQPGALGIVYRDRCGLWLDPGGFALHHRRGAYACNLQLGCLSFRHVLTCGPFGGYRVSERRLFSCVPRINCSVRCD